jgi:hypothetical protein
MGHYIVKIYFKDDGPTTFTPQSYTIKDYCLNLEFKVGCKTKIKHIPLHNIVEIEVEVHEDK